MSYYFIRPDEYRYSIYACNDDGTEEAHLAGLTQKEAERTLELAGQPIRYDDRQLTLDL